MALLLWEFNTLFPKRQNFYIIRYLVNNFKLNFTCYIIINKKFIYYRDSYSEILSKSKQALK